MAKIGRNDLCHCNSGRKYKKCCENQNMNKKNPKNNNYSLGQLVSSEIINDFREVLHEDYLDHIIIDITNDISLDNYFDESQTEVQPQTEENIY
jgi:hypothetical protein